MKYPANDNDFEETRISGVKDGDGGWELKRADGWSFYLAAKYPIHPTVGMEARFYGKGIGHRVRGLFLDDECVFYRTEAEDKELAEIELYGKNAQDWLDRWDRGRSVFSIEMGGMGPGYEQAIQITVAEMIRYMLEAEGEPQWDEKKKLEAYWKRLESSMFENETVSSLGLSGAQFGAAKSLSAFLYRHGPRHVMNDERVKDRHIQVQRDFPGGQP